jgi:signal transduction histidine kinase
MHILEVSENITITTDKKILGRILENLIKNAIEASEEGMNIFIGSYERKDYIEFVVKNESVMTDEVKYKIFNRSFSTKGKNRGIGTYSIKLLTEKFLKGKVRFISEEKVGTIFYVSLPKKY